MSGALSNGRFEPRGYYIIEGVNPIKFIYKLFPIKFIYKLFPIKFIHKLFPTCAY
jgi:hypothetical protein